MVMFQKRVWWCVGSYFNHILLRDAGGHEVYVDEDADVDWHPTAKELDPVSELTLRLVKAHTPSARDDDGYL